MNAWPPTIPRRPNRGEPANLSKAQRLLREFHSREHETLWESPWRGPHEMWAVGAGKVLYYSSDKADPGDPNDPGGEWKGYFHDHEAGTKVYLTPNRAQRVLNGARPLDVVRPNWPDVLVWLGSADGYDVRVGGGKAKAVKLDGKRGSGLQLWAFPDRSALVAVPPKGGREDDTVFWFGPNLTVGWAGVEG